MVWHISEGAWAGTRLDNLTVVAVVAGSRNLGLEKGERQTVLYVDEKATCEQRSMLAAMVKSRSADTLGKVVAIKSVPITFEAKGAYRVVVGDVLNLEVENIVDRFAEKVKDLFIYPVDAELYYKPLTPLKSFAVAGSWMNEYQDAVLGPRWSVKSGSPNAFTGTFAY